MGGGGESFDLVDWKRAGADQAHFTAEDVPELRPFVDAHFAHPSAEGKDSRVVFDFKDRSAHLVEGFQFGFPLFRVGVHGAEFEHGEWLSIFAAAALGEEHGSGRLQAGADPGDEQEEQSGEKEHGGRSDDVDDSFGQQRPRGVWGGAENEHGLASESVEARASDGGFDKIRPEPCFYAFDFAGVDDVLNFLELDVIGGHDDAFHGGGVQCFDKIFDGLLSEVGAGDDVNFVALRARQRGDEFVHFLRFAGEDDAFSPSGDMDFPAQVAAHEPFFGQEQGGGDHDLEGEYGAAFGAFAGKNDNGSNDHANDHAGLDHLTDRAQWPPLFMQ